jgi:zinc protease
MLFVLFLVASLPATAQDMKSPLPSDPKVIKGTLPNGLTYYIRQNKKPENKVELRLAVKAGSILEDADQLGLAHFMEHMNFNGLQHFEKNELVNYLQSIGVEFGADLNAYTSFDETIYILPIPTDKPGNLEKGFQIIEDWAHNALLTDKDINEERAVVLEESRMGKGADDRMMQKYLPRYASGTKYAERLPIGKDDILKNFKPDAIRRYYKDWYRPDLQAVMVVGDIDTALALKLIKEHFSGLTNPAKARPRDYVKAKPRAKAEAMVVSDKEAVTPLLQIIFPLTEKKEDVTLGDYKQTIERQLALNIINRRLRELAQSSKPPFAFAGVNFDGLIHGYESLTAVTMFSNEGVEKPLMALTAELIRARDYGFTAGELDRAKNELMAGIEKLYNERKTTPSQQYVDEYVRNFLTGEAMPGLENEYSYYKTLMPTITLQEVTALPKSWMSNMATFSLITAPQKSDLKLPTDAALLALTQKGLAQKVEAPKETAMASSLLASMPEPGKVVSQKVEEGLGATTYTLSNGVKVTIKPTEFKSDEIKLSGIRKGGVSNYGLADKYNAQYATATAAAMGFGEFTPTQIEQIMSGKVANVQMGMGDIENTITGSSNVKDFETMLQLLYLRMTSPRKDEELFDAYRMKQKQQLQFLSASPQFFFIDSTYNVLYKRNPMAPTPIPKPADFDAIKVDRALEIYRSEFGNANGYHFFLVGNIMPETALPLLETYIGSLPASGKAPEFKDNGVRPVNGKVKLDIHKGKEKQSLIVAMYHGEAPYSEDLSLRAQALAEVLNIKVIEELREKLGGIYTGGFQAEVTKDPYAHYQLFMYLPCGPENVDKLLTAANIQIQDIKNKGIETKDLDKVKSQWREKYRVSVKENSYWSGQLTNVLFWNRDKGHVLDYEKWIDSLTPADIQQTAKLLFDGKNEFISVLNPES